MIPTAIFLSILLATILVSVRLVQRARREARKKTQIFDSILQRMGDAVIVCDNSRRLTLWNEEAKRILGSSTSLHVGMELPGPFEIYRSDGKTVFPRQEAPLALALRGIDTDNIELILVNPQHPQGVFLTTSGRPLRDAHGTIQGGVIVLRDITLQKKSENELRAQHATRGEQLKETQSRLNQMQKLDAVGRLAGGLAHDFNNILGAISLYCDLASEDLENGQAVKECIQGIRQASERGSSLSRQLLIFSKSPVVRVRKVDINAAIQNLLKMLQRLIREDVEIRTFLSPGAIWVEADPGQIDQVIMNLAVNAKDALPGGGLITLQTAAVEKNGSKVAQIVVADNGAGMNEETLSKIFEPFFTTKPLGEGTGLGLATVYGIVKRANGEIRVESTLGKGTRFEIDLPLVEAPKEKAIAVKPNSTLDAKDPISVLLVEDEPELCKLIGDALRRRGFTVLKAENGPAALHLLESEKPTIHLILTDLVMPKMSGVDLVKQIRKNFPQIPVIFMSGYTTEDLPQEFRHESEVNALLQKPFNESELSQALAQALKRQKLPEHEASISPST